MFNLHPRVSQRAIGVGSPCVVIDDVLDEPHTLIDLSVRHQAAFAPASHNAFPGPELPLPDNVVARFVECFAQHARSALGARRVVQANGRLSLVTLQPVQLSPIQRVCHRDRLAAHDDECVAAAVIYLFSDERLGGTAFFSPQEPLNLINERMHRWAAMDNDTFHRETGWVPAYMTTTNEYFKREAVVEPKFNRMICYDGSLFHCSHIEHPELLNSDPAAGRLTVNLFLLCRRQAR
jgi:hypothetical protein